ncbi:mitochondrial chaperone BCS1 [Ceratobasidium sp. AG-Ba]|nr:mitochondrial chaperone BCS1 [Ceratobasidium sp. AG-Ba]
MPESIVTQLGLGKDHIPRLRSSFVQISPYFNEGFRVVFVGAVFDLTRRISEIAWYWLVRTFTVTAIFESEDEAYKWITEWLEGQPSYSTSREFEAIAKPRTAVGINPTIVKSTHKSKNLPTTLASYPPARGEAFQSRQNVSVPATSSVEVSFLDRSV